MQVMAVGFSGIVVLMIGMLVIVSNQAVEGSPTPGTCLPIEKGGTGCDDTELVKYFSNALYPVGSILTTTTDTNPGDYLGGTWEAFGDGRTLVGVDSDDDIMDTPEQTGGNKDAIVPYHNHTFTGDALPDHTHTIIGYGTTNFDITGGGNASTADAFLGTQRNLVSRGTSAGTPTGTISYAGSSDNAINANMQPFITVYFWKRVS